MTRLAARPLVALLFLAALPACDDPDIDHGLAPTGSGVIAGDAVVVVPLPAPHPAVLFLARVANADGTPLPAPVTVDLTVIPAADFDGGGSGVRTGPFAFGLVSPGVYVVSGIVDMDENFNPLVQELAQPSAADLRGGHADAATGQLVPIPVGPSEVVGEVTVLFARPPAGG